ncbi:DUF1249 domain-containing protein [Thalassotalea castellviae]|uniref:DUF1249 domain-containing protein n=1 Tax=Thalassotalea castellviae TaxID=3075612 RepID=A0ABU3A0B3_9GAMM|nr:DUF1249 domain-containing protein [Thalassotalea sp. W431]MDT0603623.1 DUF1249 domain-containing protein [Thalassotalea sp. W431]
MAIPLNKTSQYRPNLSNLMSLCDVNYMMLLRLLADKEKVGEKRSFFISDFLTYSLEVNEVTRYTSLVTMTQDSSIGREKLSNNSLFTDYLRPTMVIRLYHDARMAEVISNQGIKQVKPRYDYPNQAMHLPDEKQQINLFLKEWLQLSLQLGQSRLLTID